MKDKSTTFHVRRAVDGDQESFAWLVERLSPLLLAQASYRLPSSLRSTHEPEDLVSRTWMVAMQKLTDFKPVGQRYTPAMIKFLASILHKIRLSEAKKGPRSPSLAVGYGGADQDPMEQIQGRASEVHARALRSEAMQALNAAIADLPDKDRAVLIMRGIEQLPYERIATRVEGSRGALRQRYHSAIQRLRRSLDPEVYQGLCEVA